MKKTFISRREQRRREKYFPRTLRVSVKERLETKVLKGGATEDVHTLSYMYEKLLELESIGR